MRFSPSTMSCRPSVQTSDHAIERETGGAAAFHRAVEQFAVGGPAGVVDGRGVAAAGFTVPLPACRTFEARPGCPFDGIGGCGGYIGWGIRHGGSRRRCGFGLCVETEGKCQSGRARGDGSQGFRNESHAGRLSRFGPVCQSLESINDDSSGGLRARWARYSKGSGMSF